MFERILINNFNKKYADKKLLFCSRIYEDIAFMPNSVNKCCHCTRMPYHPPVFFPFITKNLDFKEYIKHLDRIMNSNQTNFGVCKGCKFLKEDIVPKLSEKEFIKFITINHFTKCNSNCVYCSIYNKTLNPVYTLLPVIKSLFKQKMISKDCLINWGGGEPVICPEFEQLAEFFIKKGIHQAVNSSGIEFSQTILKGLKDCSMSIQISPDSGTSETYQKIKRQNNFDKVWENIKKYAQYPDMLFVKYIFFSLSANENDVREFINKCINSGVKHIVIDCESNTANNPNSVFGNITEEIINLAVLMKNLALENNIAYEISYQWPEEYKKQIENG